MCSNSDFQTFRSFLRACLRSFFFCFSDRFSLLRSMRLKLSLSVACVMCFTAPRFEPISARDAWSPCGVCFQVSPGSSNKPTGCQNNVYYNGFIVVHLRGLVLSVCVSTNCIRSVDNIFIFEYSGFFFRNAENKMDKKPASAII